MKSLAIIIPAHNEEEIIRKNVMKTINFLKKTKLGVTWKIIVAENGSKDKTLEILKNMSKNKNFSYLSLPVRSRSQAIKQSWLRTEADYYMFMDADLSTDIMHIPELVQNLNQGYDIVIGSRRMKKSKVKRTFLRKYLSSAFHLLMQIIFPLGIHDFQCGFKAINKKVRDKILPQIKYDDEGFLDTEMIAVAHKKGYKIKEIPVRWEDDRPSKFKITRIIYIVLINSFKIKRDLLLGRYH